MTESKLKAKVYIYFKRNINQHFLLQGFKRQIYLAWTFIYKITTYLGPFLPEELKGNSLVKLFPILLKNFQN